MVWLWCSLLYAGSASAQVLTSAPDDSMFFCGGGYPFPEFPGGQDSLFAYLSRAIHYPKIADTTISGTVIIEFTLDTTGNVIDAKVFRSLHPAFDSVALQAIRQMPRWDVPAGVLGGNNRKRKELLTMRQPIHFSRKKKE
ncbi:MAG: energy transducer TonB [Bacteroidetes bacterium]|nr:energy transducer TonB [Bacteroidota bacterium]